MSYPPATIFRAAQRVSRLVFWLALFTFLVFRIEGEVTLAFAGGDKPPSFNAGLRTLGVWEPQSKERLEVAVWYPTARSASSVVLNEWRIPAVRNGREVPGRYPVILLSHDMTANRFFNNDLASHLAADGFIVIAPTHTGDSLDDASVLFSAYSLYTRPRQLLLALEAALQTPGLGPLLDETRIGLLGVGAGTVTVLQLAGLNPQADGLAAYCAAAGPGDIFCGPATYDKMSAWPEQLRKIKAGSASASLTPDLYAMHEAYSVLFKNGGPEDAAVGPRALHEIGPGSADSASKTGNGAQVSATSEQSLPQERRAIRAIGLLAPGWTMLFNQEALQGLRVPVGAVLAGRDELYPPELQAYPLLRALPAPLADPTDILVLGGADHYSLNAQCPRELAASLPEICGQATLQKRQDFAQKRDSHFSNFFKAYLGHPLPPGESADELSSSPLPLSPSN